MIEVYEDVLSQEVCNELISLFDSTDDKRMHLIDGDTEVFDMYEIPWDNPLAGYLEEITKELRKHYLEKYDTHHMIPKEYKLEGFRIKRYEPNKHFYPWHSDVSGLGTCSRYISFLFYLNDSEAVTEFADFSIEPKRGSIVMFPPLWMFPHKAHMPTKAPKYIMSTYYHYDK